MAYGALHCWTLGFGGAGPFAWLAVGVVVWSSWLAYRQRTLAARDALMADDDKAAALALGADA